MTQDAIIALWVLGVVLPPFLAIMWVMAVVIVRDFVRGKL